MKKYRNTNIVECQIIQQVEQHDIKITYYLNVQTLHNNNLIIDIQIIKWLSEAKQSRSVSTHSNYNNS